jgi:Spy/CpxP family protein refolding chaperone
VISPRLRAAGTLLVVFGLGAATGVAGTRYTSSRSLHHFLDAPPSEAHRRAIVWALERKLSLTSEQRDRIEAILASHNAEFVAIARRTEPELEPLWARVHDEMRATLTPEQQGKFDELTAKYKERRRRAIAADGM